MQAKNDAKKTMYLHSEAKVEFYQRYLERYLRILVHSPWIQEVNIFDVFCGTGIYDNGKKGSPIVALDAINALGDSSPITKSIRLVVNDEKPDKVSAVQEYFTANNRNHCTVDVQNKTADQMFEYLLDLVRKQNDAARNLIFVDPYGYKEIRKETLECLLANGRTELILFLPIAQMQRFTSHALSSDEKPYEPLKNFVQSFFPADHPIRNQTIPPLEYIDYVKEALRFGGKYYSTSYYIERDASNYYALFFMSSHIYGFDKILEVKWLLDEEDGRGFRQPESFPKMPLFADKAKELANEIHYERLENILASALATPKNNLEIYEIILQNEFRHTHCNEVFKRWQETKPEFTVVDAQSHEPVSKGRFYIGWDHYKTKTPKVIFRLGSS